jgi:formate-dependent nitrite reductase membrane component NrfD
MKSLYVTLFMTTYTSLQLHEIIAVPILHNEKPAIPAIPINHSVSDAKGNFTMFPWIQSDRLRLFSFEV